MIWCAYCQQFLRESAPYEELLISHGICEKCSVVGISGNPSQAKKLRQLVSLQQELYSAGKAGDLSRIEPLLQDSIALGVRPIDMIFGFLNPMLVKLGALWKEGKITVIEEHRFTNFCEHLLHALSLKTVKKAQRPDFILANADGNYHSFGVRVLQLWLESVGYSAELIVPSVPMKDLLSYTLEVKPQFVGISVSLPDQLADVKFYIESLSRNEHSPVRQIFIGGYASKTGIIKSADVAPARLITDPKDLLSYLSLKQKAS